MRLIRSWIFVPLIFVVNAVTQTVLAWYGSQFALIMLAVTTVFLAVVVGEHIRGRWSALEGWERSTEGWAAAQTWGMKQDQILRDALQELWEYDEEAVEIHHGRSVTASIEYLKTFGEEDTAAMLEELRKERL